MQVVNDYSTQSNAYQELHSIKLQYILNKNISFVPKYGLCTMCSTCEGVCPEDAINMLLNSKKGIFEPVVDQDKCVECGTCLKICPGYSVDIRDSFEKTERGINRNELIGDFTSILRMRATVQKVFKDGTSGGMATMTMLHLITSGTVDGAIVTKMNDNNPLESTSYIAKTEEELLLSQKSKYIPTRLNAILKTIIRDKTSKERLAFIGLPCHVEGLRKAQEVIPALKDKIVIVLSLFCSRTPTLHATKFLLNYHKVNIKDLKRIDYRGYGHPGKLTLYLSNGNSVYIDHLHWTYWGYAFSNFFWPTRCFLCPDKTGELADISFGDNWQGLRNKEIPSSSTVIRNKKAKELIDRMANEGIATIVNPLNFEEFIKDQDLVNKRSIGNRIMIMKLFARKVPQYNEKFNIDWKNMLNTFRMTRHVIMAEHDISYGLLYVYIYLSYMKSRFIFTLKKGFKFRSLLLKRLRALRDWSYKK